MADEKEGFTTFQSPLVRAVSPKTTNNEEKTGKGEGMPGSRMSMKRTSRMSDVLEGVLGEQGALGLKPVSPAEANEARRSLKLASQSRTPTGECTEFEPNIFLPDLCGKCSKKRAAHGPPASEDKGELPNVSAKKLLERDENNRDADEAPATSSTPRAKTPKAKTPQAASRTSGSAGLKSPAPAKHGYKDDDIFSSSDEEGSAEDWKVEHGAALSPADRSKPPITRMMDRWQTAIKVETEIKPETTPKSGGRAMSPSLKLAEVTPSTITPELKQELIDILLRRRRRLYGITDDSVPVVQGEVGGGASATAAASSSAGSTSPAQLVPDLPPDAKPDPSRMVITSSTAAGRRSIRKGAKFQTLPARSSASLAPIKDMLAGRLALQQPEAADAKERDRSSGPSDKKLQDDDDAPSAKEEPRSAAASGEKGGVEEVQVVTELDDLLPSSAPSPKPRSRPTSSRRQAADAADKHSADSSAEPKATGGDDVASAEQPRAASHETSRSSARAPVPDVPPALVISTSPVAAERDVAEPQRSATSPTGRPLTSSPLGRPLTSSPLGRPPTSSPLGRRTGGEEEQGAVENPIIIRSSPMASRKPPTPSARPLSPHPASRPSSPSVLLAMEAPPAPARSGPSPKGSVSPSSAAAAAAAARSLQQQQSASSGEDGADRASGSLRRHRPSQVSREFKQEVVEYLDRLQSGEVMDARLFQQAAGSPTGSHAEVVDEVDLHDVVAEDGALLLNASASPQNKNAKAEAEAGGGRHSRHPSLDIGQPPPTKAKLTQWLRRPLVAHAQCIKTLCRRIRPSPGQVLMPSRFVMHLPDFENKAVLLAEGQSALDPRTSNTYQIYVGPGPKGDSVAALKRLPRDGAGGEGTVYQLLYCDERKGTWGETAVFRFTPGFADRNSPRQVEVWLTKGAEAWVGTDQKDTLASCLARGDATGAIGLHHREPLWNVHRKRFEMPLLFGHDAPRGGLEPSVKAVQLVESGSKGADEPAGQQLPLQFFRVAGQRSSDRDVFHMDVGAPLSLIQAFAFAIANMECEAKGAKIAATNSEELGLAPQPEHVLAMEEQGDELTGEAASKAPPVTNLYSGFMHYVASPMMAAWALRPPSDRYGEGGGGNGQQEAEGQRPVSSERRQASGTAVRRAEAAGGGDGRPSGARGGGVEDDPYDSNTSSLAQLREAWRDGRLRMELDQFSPQELRKLLEVPPLTVVDFLLLTKAIFYRTRTHTRLCLTFLVLSMLAELYPQSPTYNTALAMASLYVNLHIKDFKESFLLAYFMLHTASLLFDLNWIVQIYTGLFMSRLKYFCVAMVAAGMALKLSICIGTLRTTTPGVSVLQFVGSYLKLLLPPAMGASRGGLLVEVYGRLILLTWMHFLGGLAFLVVFLTIIVRFPFEDDFQTELWQIPLSVVVLFKGISSLAVSGALFRNMQLTSCLGMFGCLTCCYEWAVLKESKHTRKYRGVEAPPVLINGEWAKLVMLMKTVDVLVAAFLWAILLMNYDQLLVLSQYSVQQMCATIFAMSILLDVWGLILGAAVGWLYSVHKYRSKLNGRGKHELSVGPGYMSSRSWAPEEAESDEDDDGGEARPIDMDDIEATIFQTDAPYESPRRQARQNDQQWASQTQGADGYYDGQQEGYDVPPPLVFLDAFSFSPEDFQYLWDTLPPLVGFDCYISYVPTVQEVSAHLQSTCFFVIASGTQGSVSRVYACARAQDAKGRDISFLAEVLLDAEQYTMGTTFKCDNVERIGDFMAMLSLRDVVGEYTPIPDGPHTVNAAY